MDIKVLLGPLSSAMTTMMPRCGFSEPVYRVSCSILCYRMSLMRDLSAVRAIHT